MKKRVVMKGHKLRRDVAANIVIKRLLENIGFKVFLTSKENHRLILQFWKPHIVVEETPSISTTKNRSPNSIFILLHTEGGLAENLLPSLDDIRKYDYIFCWGNDQYEKLIEYCPELYEKGGIIVTGNPRMDLMKFNKDHANCNKSKSIGIMSSGRILYRCDHPDVLQLLSEIKNEKTKHSSGTDGEIYCLYLEVIEKIIKESDYNISFRPHPNEQISAFKFLENKYLGRFCVDDTLDLSKWVRMQRTVISTASSSYLEAYVEKVPCINLDQMADVDMSKVAGKNQLNAYKTAIFPKNIKEIINIIKEPKLIEKNTDIDDILKNNYNYDDGSSSISCVVNRILMIEKEGKYNVPKLSLPYWLVRLFSLLLSVRAYIKNKHIKDYSYEGLYHGEPSYLIKLGDYLYKKYYG